MIIYYLRKLLNIPKSRPLSPKEQSEYKAAESDFTAEGAPVAANPAGHEVAEQESESPTKPNLN